jgi:hypothetical protein
VPLPIYKLIKKDYEKKKRGYEERQKVLQKIRLPDVKQIA